MFHVFNVLIQITWTARRIGASLLLSVVLLWTLTLMEIRNNKLSRSPLIIAVCKKFLPLLSGCSAAPEKSNNFSKVSLFLFLTWFQLKNYFGCSVVFVSHSCGEGTKTCFVSSLELDVGTSKKHVDNSIVTRFYGMMQHGFTFTILKIELNILSLMFCVWIMDMVM